MDKYKDQLPPQYMEYDFYQKMKLNDKYGKSNQVYFKSFDNNVYFRNEMKMINGGMACLPGDVGFINRPRKEGMDGKKEDELLASVYSLIPMAQYNAKFRDVAAIHDRLEYAFRVLNEKSKAEYNKAISEGKSHEDAVNIAKTNCAEEKLIYDQTRKELIVEGAKLDRLYNVMCANAMFVTDNKLGPEDVGAYANTIDESYAKNDKLSKHTFGYRIRVSQQEHSNFQKNVKKWMEFGADY